MLLSQEAIGSAAEICRASDFYSPRLAIIFDAIMSLDSRGAPADSVTVADELNRRGLLEEIGGPVTLSSLTSATFAIANVERYARIVEEHALLRKLIVAAAEISDLGYSMPEDIQAALDHAESAVFSVAERHSTDTIRPLNMLLSESLDHIEMMVQRGTQVTGVRTGYLDLDKILLGLQPSNLVIVGARPAMGKTSFALGMLTNAAKSGVPALFFSLEMSHHEITQRILSSESRVESSAMRTGKMSAGDMDSVHKAINRLTNVPIFIDDNPNLTVMDIRAKARRLKASSNIGLVVIDYLQLMSGRGKVENRQVEISEISRGLKILARELGVPVVALSQLSRNLEARQDKRPVLADLRESGSLEQDADVVLFIYRDEIYNQDPDNYGIAEIHISKHRNGPTGKIELSFLPGSTTFANMARD
jgi:replicative DNA helicase